MGLIEEWGTGLQRVIERCREIGLSDPRFEDLDTAFRVSLIRGNSVKKEGMTELNDNSVKNDNKMTELDNNSVKKEKMTELTNFINQLKEKDRDKALLVINYLNNNSSITSIEASSLLNVSESTCRRLLLKCESLGLLYSTGQTRNRRYYLTTK